MRVLMRVTILRWGAFFGAAASVVACVYLFFGALVAVEPLALPPAPEMPEGGIAGVVMVEVERPAPAKPRAARPRPAAPKPASKPVAPAPTEVERHLRSNPVSDVPTTKPAARPQRTTRKPTPAPVVVEAPLELYRNLADSKKSSRTHEPDAGVPNETSRPAATTAPKPKQKRREPDAGVADEPSRSAEKETAMGKERARGGATVTPSKIQR
jgi:hypothetical protein